MSDTEERLWRVDEWLRATGISRAKFYAEIRAGRVDARNSGRCTHIATSPTAWFSSLPPGIGAAFGNGRRKKADAA
jgi:hypothetical protein